MALWFFKGFLEVFLWFCGFLRGFSRFSWLRLCYLDLFSIFECQNGRFCCFFLFSEYFILASLKGFVVIVLF